jgi:uncharacterized protein YyaL (SSP411 family)
VVFVLFAMACSAPPDPLTAGKNRLGGESSPYLRLHAENPVHWYAWGPDALEAAKRHDKPIFLSIGYSACHWCHVMNRESFADPAIAAVLNEHFICIKVDREERPDVDQVYMEAVQALTGRGGWPLSIFLLPDGRPFFGGTYFPNAAFRELLLRVIEVYRERRSDIQRQAAAICEFLERQNAMPNAKAAEPTKEMMTKAAGTVRERLDPEFGGLAAPPRFAPKFPQPTVALFLLEHVKGTGDKASLDAIVRQADHMASGGIYDHIGGGFHRYAVDREWIIPHFEKMLYDQGQLVSLYSRLYRLRPDPVYRQVVEETIEFVRRELTSPDGLFYAALDADSEHEEGKFYSWTQAELRAALDSDASWALAMLGADGEPNFEGKYVLVRARTFSQAAQSVGQSETTLRERWSRMRSNFLTIRDRRTRPLRDTKIITAWNGLMILGLCDAADAFQDENASTMARKAADQLLARLRRADGTLYHHEIDSEGRGVGYADDYAAAILALLAVHRQTKERRYFDAADRLAQVFLAQFWDDKGKGVYYTGRDHEPLVLRLKETYDGAVPSANGLAALVLVELGTSAGGSEYRTRAADLLRGFATALEQNPVGMTTLLRAAWLRFWDRSTTGEPPDAKPPVRTNRTDGS